MIKREAKWNTLWNEYVRLCNRKGIYFYYELKQTEKDSLSYSAIEQHQIDGLLSLKKYGFVWKLSDQDQRQKPCDGINTPPLPSYLVIKFPDGFYMIEISVLMQEKNKSLTVKRAREISEKVIHF